MKNRMINLINSYLLTSKIFNCKIQLRKKWIIYKNNMKKVRNKFNNLPKIYRILNNNKIYKNNKSKIYKTKFKTKNRIIFKINNF